MLWNSLVDIISDTLSQFITREIKHSLYDSTKSRFLEIHTWFPRDFAPHMFVFALCSIAAKIMTMSVSICWVLRFLLVNYWNRGEVLGTPNTNNLLRNERTYEAEEIFPLEAILHQPTVSWQTDVRVSPRWMPRDGNNFGFAYYLSKSLVLASQAQARSQDFTGQSVNLWEKNKWFLSWDTKFQDNLLLSNK